jgi:mRNA interferase MazF
MRRGEVWWSEQPPPTGNRPVLLLSRDSAYETRQLVIVARVTTRRRGIRTEVTLTVEDGMPRDSVINVDTIDTIPKVYLRRPMTMLSDEKMRSVEEALRFALELPPFRRGQAAG